MFETCSKLTTETPNDVIDVILVSLLLTLNILTPFSTVSIAEFEQVNVYSAVDAKAFGIVPMMDFEKMSYVANYNGL